MASKNKKLINFTERDGVGIAWLWFIADHPFHVPAVWHDQQYVLQEHGQQSFTRKQVDRIFYVECLNIAGDDWKLKAQAKLFYGIVRALGWCWW